MKIMMLISEYFGVVSLPMFHSSAMMTVDLVLFDLASLQTVVRELGVTSHKLFGSTHIGVIWMQEKSVCC